jgi:hypothetical protein
VAHIYYFKFTVTVFSQLKITQNFDEICFCRQKENVAYVLTFSKHILCSDNCKNLSGLHASVYKKVAVNWQNVVNML